MRESARRITLKVKCPQCGYACSIEVFDVLPVEYYPNCGKIDSNETFDLEGRHG